MASICVAKPLLRLLWPSPLTLPKAGFADGGKQGGFILEVPVRGRSRNTQLFADLAQCERVNPFPLDQFEPAFNQRGT